jgi:hypothetical protein
MSEKSNLGSALSNFNMPSSYTPNVKNYPYINKDEPYYASSYYDKLVDYIVEFEKQLKDDEEVGAKLVSFGESIIIHIDDIGYKNPRLICFYGYDTQGQKVQLIQHVNQISVLLIVVKRTNPERVRIGFKLTEQQKEDTGDDDE